MTARPGPVATVVLPVVPPVVPTDMLHFALREFSTGSDEALFVGDSIADVRAAEAAGLPCILIEGGYTVEATAKLGAWKTVSDFERLVKLLTA